MNRELELGPDTLTGLSLESVVQKASDLAHTLRTCRHNAESEQSQSAPNTDHRSQQGGEG